MVYDNGALYLFYFKCMYKWGNENSVKEGGENGRVGNRDYRQMTGYYMVNRKRITEMIGNFLEVLKR